MALNIQWLYPAYIWLLPLLLTLDLGWRKFFAPGSEINLNAIESWSRGRFRHPLLHLIPQAPRHGATPYLIRGLIWVILTSLVLALSQPVRLEKQRPRHMQGRDITFIVDTSLSMALRDYELAGQRVERIHLLKGLLKKIVSQLQEDRISIIVFGESAYTLVPLTKDQALLGDMIDRITAGMVGRHNAIGDSIALAVREARQRGDNGGDNGADHSADNSGDNKRILVLLTDAGTHTGKISPHAAAQLASEAGLSLYIVAIGATTDAAEEKTGYSGLLFQTVEMPLLEELAALTGGKSYLASDSGAINNAITDITQHDSNPVLSHPSYVMTELYPWLLLPALAGMGILPLLGWRQ